jgi:hypothetical protein
MIEVTEKSRELLVVGLCKCSQSSKGGKYLARQKASDLEMTIGVGGAGKTRQPGFHKTIVYVGNADSLRRRQQSVRPAHLGKETMLTIAIILGSTRPGRRREALSNWAYNIARKRSDADFELLEDRAFSDAVKKLKADTGVSEVEKQAAGIKERA